MFAAQHWMVHTVNLGGFRGKSHAQPGGSLMAAVAELKHASARKDLYAIGEIPPLGHVPERMHAWTIRKERHGPPTTSMQLEIVPTWSIGDGEVLVYVMAGGVNYNGIWAALGTPISVIDVHKSPYHIAGSDAAGLVWAVGAKVKRWKVGDEVIVHCNQDDGDDEDCNGGDPMLSPSQRIWGYETPDGSFAQFCRVQSRQLMTKPKHLTWEESASYTLTLATAYRMLFGHPPHTLKPGDNVLVWGASGGLGRQRHRRHLGREQAAIRARTRRQGRHQSQGFQLLGPDAEGRHAGIRRLGQGGAQIRQGDLGYHWQAGRRYGARASGRADVSGVMPGGQAGRHGGVLRRHYGLQPHLRCTLRMDAPEAHPGLPFRPSQTGKRCQPVRARPPDRPVHERSLRLGPHPACP